MTIYTPKMIEAMSANPKRIREAYAELRKVAQKRFKRLQAQKLTTNKSFKFPMTKTLSDADAAYYLAEVSRYLKDSQTTVKGAKRARDYDLQLFHEKGLTFINEDNYMDFVQYMDELRHQYDAKIFDSGDAADVFNEAQRIGIDTNTIKKDFDYFAEHLEDLERLKPVRSEKGATFSAIKQKIKRLQ